MTTSKKLRRLASATACAALTLPAACDSGHPGPFTKADWATGRKADISCRGDVTAVSDDQYDLDGDGHDEVFLVMRCASPKDPPGDQLEVIPGGMTPDNAVPIKLVLQMPQPYVVHGPCFVNKTAVYQVTGAGQAQMWQLKWAADAAKPSSPVPGPPGGCL